MDVIKENKKQTFDKKHIVGVVIVVVVLLGWFFAESGPKQTLERKDLLVSSVVQGQLNIQVEGYGKLRSSKQKLLTSQSNATVDEIVLKPGALVTADSIILQLKNPTLEHEVTVAKQAYGSQSAALRKLRLTQIRELLSNEEKLELMKADYEMAKVRKVAMDDLVEEGIVSRLDYNEADLTTKQLKKRVAITEQSVEKLKQVHQESVNIQKEEIENAKGNYDEVLARLEQLTVKAGMQGILQKLPVELGQSLVIGQQMALIGGTEDLIALVKVPQAEAAKIRVGQKASIDTRKDIIESEVSRVSPTVEDGSVEIEISLTGTLPAQLRPEQNVDAIIFIETIDNAYYVQRPANVQAFSTTMLYKLSADQLSAQPTSIQFGVTSGRSIQISSGAVSGDNLIISDMSYLNNIPVIGLNN